MSSIKQALVKAIEALEYHTEQTRPIQKTIDTITDIKLTLAELEKCERETSSQPVGDEWTPCMKLPIVVHVRKQRDGEAHVSTREGLTPLLPSDLIMRGISGEEYPIGKVIFDNTYTYNTAPQQREWVDLTNEQIYEAVGDGVMDIALAIEAKLKELNTKG